MRSVREYLVGCQDGSGWTEVVEMLCLVVDCEARKIEARASLLGY